MLLKQTSRKLLRVTAYILGVMLALMTAFHFWFINHAEDLVEDMVYAQSGGKLELKVDKFKFNWFSYNMELRDANFFSRDTSAATSYQFSVPRVKIRVKEILPLVLEKKILIDSLHLFNPDIRVTRLRLLKDSTDKQDTGISLPQEMGKIYNSIQDALKVLQVDRFQIDKGRFSLVNKIRPDEPPVVITDINIQLDNLQVDTTQPGTAGKILFSDNLALHTSQQDIVFPDGRHRLNFRHFRINLANRIVEFDSCTVMATRDDSTDNSFSIYFDKLQMTNIDFTTLYHNEIIKADSVYCLNPRFRLNVSQDDQSGKTKTPPRLDELVRQLTGNMQLAFVVVENASFDINTNRDGLVSSFTSENNNFELQGLQINKFGQKPLTVEKFVMAIRNYENFLRDSSYAIQFDSILINDNRISLSNFSYQELDNGKVLNQLSMPQFELQGLSWDDLVINKKLSAQRVNLYQPVINYTVIRRKNKAKDVFEVLADLGNFMKLENLTINNGQVNLYFKNNIRLSLENANIAVLGRQLVDSRKLTSIQNSVTSLYFKKGVFKTRHLTADLADVSFFGQPDNYLHAGMIHIRNPDEIDITAKDASIQSMVINDDLEQSAISGIHWKRADIKLHAFPSTKKKSASFLLKDIHGENTRVLVRDSSRQLSVLLHSVKADSLATNSGNKLHMAGLSAVGENLAWSTPGSRFGIKNFGFADRQPSTLEQIQFTQHDRSDSVDAAIPMMKIVPDINSLINGKLYAGAVQLSKPIINVRLKRTNGNGQGAANWPEVKIDALVIEQPSIDYTKITDFGTTHISWKGQGKVFDLQQLDIDAVARKLSAKTLQLSLGNFMFTTTGGKKFDAGKGNMDLTLDQLRLQRNEAGAWDWSGHIQQLKAADFVIDSLGKRAGRLSIERAGLDDLIISSANLLNFREILIANKSFRLRELTGSYKNDRNHFNWYNTGYDKNTRIFTTDSFRYKPAMERETFIDTSTYQADYITAQTGAITIGPLDINRFARDSVLDMGTITIESGVFADFRDKRKPRLPGQVRLLPASLVKEIPVRLEADTIRVNNAHIEYEEVNEKTGAAGKIVVADLDGSVTQVRNYNLSKSDSLHISATALLEHQLFTRLEVKESYTDSLGGFLMNVHMDSADLRIFNPVLKPLTSAELRSGYLDSMSMRVVGREAFAVGEMKMVYRDLKIRVTADEQKKLLFGGKLRSFFANTLVKNKNTKRTGTVFFQRLRDRSAINYLVKITFSGISSSIGIKKSDRLARKNKKLLLKTTGDK